MTVETDRSSERDPSPAEFAEAAAWVARLHGPNRTAQVEKGLRRWLEASPAHAAALEAMTAAWEATGKLPQESFPRLSRWQRAGYREGFIRSVLAVAAIAAVAIGTGLYLHRLGGIATGIGEQRLLTLDDGTRVFLNTATRLVVKYDKSVRKVELKGGEALFDVARRADWPFIVEAGDRQVRALGTSFIVRRDSEDLAVTLVEGKVTVSPVAVPAAADPQSSVPSSAQPRVQADHAEALDADAEIITLSPGQRVMIAAHRPPMLDQPAIEKMTAWRRGLVDFENTPLAEAVAEMNRYSVLRLVIDGPQAAAIPITGVFRTGDAPSFAAAVARAYQLQVVEESSEIRLTGIPAAATHSLQ